MTKLSFDWLDPIRLRIAVLIHCSFQKYYELKASQLVHVAAPHQESTQGKIILPAMLDITNYLGSNSNISKTKHRNYDLKCNFMVYFELFIQMKTGKC